MLFSLRAVPLFMLAGRALAHIEMASPPPLRSKYNPATPSGSIDYSMSAPLADDGSNFPCKGYHSDFDSTSPVATLASGSQFTVQLAGTATHGGGSCQFAISYDQAKTWAVLASVEGGCPIGLSYTFPVPADLPSAPKALFAWTWFNKVGNREMYMNCAVVKTTGSSSTYTGPTLFRANTFADGTCKTIEGQEYVFPNPGPSVQFGGSISASSPATVLEPCSYDQNANVTVGPGSSASAPVNDTSPSASGPITATLTSAQPVKMAQQSSPSSTPVNASDASSLIRCDSA